jgi:GTPase SAR1 family protein
MSILDELNRIRRELEAYDSVEVKVALFSTPGSGKSSLINALVGQHVAKIGVENEVTSAEHFRRGELDNPPLHRRSRCRNLNLTIATGYSKEPIHKPLPKSLPARGRDRDWG